MDFLGLSEIVYLGGDEQPLYAKIISVFALIYIVPVSILAFPAELMLKKWPKKLKKKTFYRPLIYFENQLEIVLTWINFGFLYLIAQLQAQL